MISPTPFEFATRLWPIFRSLTGSGNRLTLSVIKEQLPNLSLKFFNSGEKVFDWNVPSEWEINSAYILTPDGSRICDINDNNLHLVGYSKPINKVVSLEELQLHLYSIEDIPDAIPYVTSYYKRDWGFCISHEQRMTLKPGNYQVIINSKIFDGRMDYGELYIKGSIDKEVLISTYICHPSMANNEISGPTVSTFLAKWLSSFGDTKYSYRFVFLPETIGSIAFLSRNLVHLKSSVIAGFNLSCVGDTRCYSYLPSRSGETISDRILKYVLIHADGDVKYYTWLDRGSDERQYCAPGVDLPVCTFMRSKFACYPEYHTSKDNLDIISNEGLSSSIETLKTVISLVESNIFPLSTCICEPMLGKRNLYPSKTISSNKLPRLTQYIRDFISYSDGTHDTIAIGMLINCPPKSLIEVQQLLLSHNLIIEKSEPCHGS
tara:strand:+ start:1461 stop:2762 length:1302 start_codon:yes stop_codon:yes gene_type:complete